MRHFLTIAIYCDYSIHVALYPLKTYLYTVIDKIILQVYLSHKKKKLRST